MKVAVTGLPQSGKTTVFNVLTGRTEEVGTFSTKTSVAVVPVEDSRLDRLWEEYKPPKKVYPTLVFHDLPPGCKETEAFALLRETDLIVVVLHAFGGDADPATDASELASRFALSDMQIIENRLERIEKQVRRPSADHDSLIMEQGVLKSMAPLLEEGRMLTGFELTREKEKLIHHYGFLTLKPAVYVLNAGEEQASSPPSYKDEDALVIFGKLEMEIEQLGGEDQKTFLEEYGIAKSAPELVRRVYDALNIVTFFTPGDDEVRGWTVRAGTTAPEAAGKVHSDMEKGFIKAEVVLYEKFLEIGSYKEARHAAARLEGKDYLVQDGDIINFRFNP